jgi:8-hydroxy-5-deazaflavin:NADPH oxidoreductase
MHITMIGDSRLIRPLSILATRAGNTVIRVDEMATDVASCSLSEMMIVAGDRSAVTDSVARVGSMTSEDTVIVDATATIESSRSDGEEELVSESEWVSLLPSTRIVRAFASVPVDAFTSIVDRETRTADDELAVPLAGDDAAAKEIVAEFMRQIGVEPFDLGPLTVSYVMEPGGPLWGKAVDSLDMRECIGWLSGDG